MGQRGNTPSGFPGFACGEQGLGPCSPPVGPSAPLDSLTKGVFDPSGLPFRLFQAWSERRVTDAPHDRTRFGFLHMHFQYTEWNSSVYYKSSLFGGDAKESKGRP